MTTPIDYLHIILCVVVYLQIFWPKFNLRHMEKLGFFAIFKLVARFALANGSQAVAKCILMSGSYTHLLFPQWYVSESIPVENGTAMNVMR